MSADEIKIAVAESVGTRFGGPYERYKWETEIPREDDPTRFLWCEGFRCVKCQQHHIGNTLVDAYCDCGLNPEWINKGVAFWKWEHWKNAKPVPDYPNDLNAILPLLPAKTIIKRRMNGAGHCWWTVESQDSQIICRGDSLAPTACEFYLRTKALWKDEVKL